MSTPNINGIFNIFDQWHYGSAYKPRQLMMCKGKINTPDKINTPGKIDNNKINTPKEPEPIEEYIAFDAKYRIKFPEEFRYIDLITNYPGLAGYADCGGGSELMAKSKARGGPWI